MKPLQLITITFVVLIYESCTPTTHVNGRYTNVFAGGVAGEEFKFIRKPNTFEYYSRTEGAVKNYSWGTWAQNKKTIFLNGLNDKNINLLNIESSVQDNQYENKSKIVVQYKDDPLDTFTKLEVVLNENSKVWILGDTTFFTDEAIRTLQVKTYLIHENLLLRTPPCIDTLYSPIIKVSDPDKRSIILLKINVTQKDFYRTQLTDTLDIKNGHTLIWRKKEFKKIKD